MHSSYLLLLPNVFGTFGLVARFMRVRLVFWCLGPRSSPLPSRIAFMNASSTLRSTSDWRAKGSSAMARSTRAAQALGLKISATDLAKPSSTSSTVTEPPYIPPKEKSFATV